MDRSLAGYSPWCHKQSDMTEWLSHTHTDTHTHIRGGSSTKGSGVWGSPQVQEQRDVHCGLRVRWKGKCGVMSPSPQGSRWFSISILRDWLRDTSQGTWPFRVQDSLGGAECWQASRQRGPVSRADRLTLPLPSFVTIGVLLTHL